jgi:putative holliday junction resolvase
VTRNSAGPEVVLALDFGLRRIGVAVGDTLTASARPLAALLVPQDRAAAEPEYARVRQVAVDFGAARVVVGCPYNADGSEGRLTGLARRFAAQLAAVLPLPVHMVDERYSSLEAQQRLGARRASGQRRRRVDAQAIDSAAAAVILERWFAGDASATAVRPVEAQLSETQQRPGDPPR